MEPSTALFQPDVQMYVYGKTLEEVENWIPEHKPRYRLYQKSVIVTMDDNEYLFAAGGHIYTFSSYEDVQVFCSSREYKIV